MDDSTAKDLVLLGAALSISSEALSVGRVRTT
jgi:hypothetical protein